MQQKVVRRAHLLETWQRSHGTVRRNSVFYMASAVFGPEAWWERNYGFFADSSFILSNCPEIKDESPSAQWLPATALGCFRKKGSSEQFVPGKSPLQLVSHLHLVFITFSALSKLRPREGCGLKLVPKSFQQSCFWTCTSNICCPLKWLPVQQTSPPGGDAPVTVKWREGMKPREAGWPQRKALVTP